MTNKYYTPDISDIRIGYECEASYEAMTFVHSDILKPLLIDINSYKNKWLPVKVEPYTALESVISLLTKGYLRTPYLTKEQIETEGWDVIQIYPSNATIFLKGTIHEGYEVLWAQNKTIKITKVWSIFEGEKYFRSDIYVGNCFSINEFRYITNKLLNIN